MAMEVEVILETSAVMLLQPTDKLIERLDLWIYPSVWIQELPIEILPTVTRSEVAQYNTVWIHHWHHPELMGLQ